MPEQTVTRQHLAGLELARQRLAPDIHDEKLLDDLIAQASAAPAAEQSAPGEVELTGHHLYEMWVSASGLGADPWPVVTHEHTGWNGLADRLNAARDAGVVRVPVELLDAETMQPVEAYRLFDAEAYRDLQSRLDSAHAELNSYQDMLQSTSLECGEKLDCMERKLAERDALLSDWYAANANGHIQVSDNAYHVVTRTASLLSASAEPAARLVADNERYNETLRRVEMVISSAVEPAKGGDGEAV